jgi:phosphopantothenoylcysteine synthetase/decarboxylase
LFATEFGVWDKEAELAMGHIELAKWADAILIAPASANTDAVSHIPLFINLPEIKVRHLKR